MIFKRDFDSISINDLDVYDLLWLYRKAIQDHKELLKIEIEMLLANWGESNPKIKEILKETNFY